MQVLILDSNSGGNLTTDGAALRARAKIGVVKQNGRGLLGVTPFKEYSRAHPNGIVVRGTDNVVLIVGGRKSIVAALTDYPLLFNPSQGQPLCMRVMRQLEQVSLASSRLKHGIAAPVYAIKQTKARADGLLNRVADTAQTFVAIHEALDGMAKKYVYIQIYSGSAQGGDYALSHGGKAVDSRAIAVQLQALRGWAD